MPSGNIQLERPGTPIHGGAMDAAPRAPLIVISGPSGVGKTTLVEKLLEDPKLPLRRAVTATTRKERPGEVDGVSYHFWSVEQFRKALEDGRMLEAEIVHGRDYYGTPRDEVDHYRAQGFGVILVIDVKGAASIRALYPSNHVSVFITAPIAELERRLRARGAECEERILERLQVAYLELARAHEFDYTIENTDLEWAVQELDRVIQLQFNAWKS
jgi:guanylate kinase